uniref:Uncharacterized protein n=1 Tax=Spongospora subterranea TaxID=70186 RepID=A0A0H5QHQ9_9EUKA|eukprot:CRZ01513.1 hypothetical protein [Spongospora subterranea]
MPLMPSSPSPGPSYGPIPSGFIHPDRPMSPAALHLQYASSPRRDLIPSVAQRVASLFVSGFAGHLLINANIHHAESKGVTKHPTYRTISPFSPFDDLDGDTPSKQIDTYLKRRGVFELLEVDLVVGGFICNKSLEGVTIQIEKIVKNEIDKTVPKKRQLSETIFDGLKEMQIEGLCPIRELTEPNGHNLLPSELLDQFPLGTEVKALVISIDTHSDVIYFSFDNSRLTSQQSHHIPLGMVSVPNVSTIPPASPFHHWRQSTWFNHPSQALHDRTSLSIMSLASSDPLPSFVDRLKGHPLFQNPHGMVIMSKAFNVTEHGSLLSSHPCEAGDLHYNLRAAQNIDWALKGVARGIEFARQNRFSDAVRCYSHALNVEPQCVDALVSRGIAMINLNKLDDAIKDLTHALDLEPGHVDAAKYITLAKETKLRLITISEGDGGNDDNGEIRLKRQKLSSSSSR